MGRISSVAISRAIAFKTAIAARPMDRPNSILEVGIFQSEMGSMPQVGMLKALKLNAPEINSGVDTIYNGVTGKGQINIPDTKEFYTGEALYNG